MFIKIIFTHHLQSAIASLTLLFIVMVSTPLQAGNLIQMTEPATLSQSYFWYDGNTKRQLWLNEQVVAEFSPYNSSSLARQAGRNLNPVPGKTLKLRLKSDIISTTSSANLRASQQQISEILHERASNTSRFRALPGNIIVYLKSEWDQASIDRWLAENGLQIEKKLTIRANALVIKAAPGLASLQIANELYESGAVDAAFPVWWQEFRTR